MIEPVCLLVVDPDLMVRALYARLLTADGYRVETAATARDALDHLRAERYDAILTATTLRDMSGLDFYQEVLREHPGLRQCVIFMLTQAERPEVMAFLQQHAPVPMLHKPFGREELQRVLEAVLAVCGR